EIYHSLLEADVDEAIAVAPVQMHVQSTCQAWQRYTMFADDLHGSWLIRDVAGFRAAIAELLSLIRLLQDLGMAVNFQKSLAVLRLRGSSVPRINRSFLVWRDGAQYLRLRSEPQDIFLPLAGMMPYLGVTLSDDNFELQTFRARAGSAQARFQELRRVLRSQGPLAERHRLRLYKATVWPTLWYALAMVGVTVDVLRGVSSLLAGHLRKVLRIYKEGVSNEQVLCQADLRPAEFLLAQTRRKQASIQEDAHRSVELKAPELARVGALLELLEVSAEVPGTTTLTASLRSEVAFIPCPVCGVYYDSQGSLNMHIQHRHPHIHQEAKLAFSKERHSLFGLPHCRFCRSRLHDWRSLARHVATGTCPRLKEFAALGLDEAAMLQRITDEEARDPPAPPEGVRLPSAAQGLVDEALRVTPEQLGTHGACLRVLAQSCALCGQLVKEAGKMKTHWMRSHKEDWAQVSGVIVGEAKSLLSTFRTPCEYCGSKAKQVADHAGKCPALFQLLAVRHLRRVGHTSSGIQLAPSLKQREAPPQYQSFDLGHTALGRYFKAPPKSDEPSAKSASVSVPRRDMPPARGCAPAAGSGSGPPGLQSALSTIPDVPKMPWVQRLVLRNPQNYCYMNSAVMAVLHCFGGYDALPRGFQMLYTLCGKAVATAKSLVLASQLQIRAALRDWVFDERQHDVAEFAGVLLPGLGLGLGGWEARAPAEEGVAVYMRGQMPLLLPLGTEACELQHCLHEWHHSQGVLHAVVATGPSELLLVQLSRHRQGSKVMTPVTLGELVRVPFFGHGLEVQWRCYLVKAVIEHHGESVQAGHYRAVLRVNQRWMLTDDGVAAIGVEWDALSLMSHTTEPMAVETHQESQEEWEFYKSLAQRTGSEQKGGSGGRGGQGKGRNGNGSQKRPPQGQQSRWHNAGDGEDGSYSSWSQWKGGEMDYAKAIRELQYAMELVQRLLLRHEDAALLARIESSFVMHMRLNVPASVVPMLFAAAGAWRKIKQEEPQKLDRPMRCSLLLCLFEELKTRMEKTVSDADQLSKLVELGWVSVGPPVTWNFLRWDGAQKRQIVDTTRPPQSQAEVLMSLTSVQRLIPKQFVVGRFHPTRPMALEMKGDNLVFLLQTGQHGEAASEVRDHIRRLCYCSVWHLLACQLKEDRFASFAPVSSGPLGSALRGAIGGSKTVWPSFVDGHCGRSPTAMPVSYSTQRCLSKSGSPVLMQSFGSQSPEQLVSDGVIVSVTPTDGAITGDAATAGAEGEDVVMCCSSDSADQSPPEACCEECPSTEEDCEDCSLRACCPELFPPSYVRHGVYFAGMRELTATEDGMRYDFLAQQLYLIRGVSIAGLDVPSNHPVESLAFSAVAHGQISWHQLERMVQQLPCDRNLRWPQEQSHQLAPRRFTCGAWNHGPHTGLTTTTRVFPWCTRVLAGVVSTWDSQLLFSTCTLSLNVSSSWNTVRADRD
ncbi:unnamed protein product, partial [Symbiodinium sp. KB8]